MSSDINTPGDDAPVGPDGMRIPPGSRANQDDEDSSSSADARVVPPAFKFGPGPISVWRSRMSPEKVAVLLVTALITALLATALLSAEKAEASPRTEAAKAAAAAAAPPARREDPLEDLTYDELRSGRFRPAPVSRPESSPEGPDAPPATYDYSVRRGDTARVIARRELGGERHVASIARLNPDVDLAKLKAGQKLKLPVPKAKPTSVKPTGKSGQPVAVPRASNGSPPKTPTVSSKGAPAKTAVKKAPATTPKKATPAPAADPKKTKSASNSGSAIRPRTV